MMKLSIVIPAYNEEEGIRSIIERTLTASAGIRKDTGLKDVEVIVVNDGSHDRTAEIAAEFSSRNEIQLISYEKNRGYGAAIKTGFEAATGDLVSFLDADGTCDPLIFISLVNRMKETGADVVIGGRLNPGSRMPLTRKIGNIFYRSLVNAISSSRVTDIASGMRVIRMDSLGKLHPLPDGLHFTPAMSVRAILDRDLRIEEVPMPYQERIGRSKLSIVKDGFRFLRSILDIAFTYKPLRLFGFLGGLFLLTALLYGIGPIHHYWVFRNVPEDSIYRLVFIVVVAVSGIQLISMGLITQAITNLVHHYEMETAIERLLDRVVLRRLAFIGFLFLAGALLLNYRAIYEYLTLGRIGVHWSYVITGGLMILLGFQFLAFSVVNRILNLLKEQRQRK